MPGRRRSRRRRRARLLARAPARRSSRPSRSAARTVATSGRRARRAVLLAGLAFDGRVKPDLLAPGVGARDLRARARTPTARRASAPSTARAPPPRSSPAPPRCSRRRGRRSTRERSQGLLVGTARPLAGDAGHRAGRGPRRRRRARPRREIAAAPDDAHVRPRHAAQAGARRRCVTLRNVSTRGRTSTARRAHADESQPPVDFDVAPVAFELAPGASVARARHARHASRRRPAPRPRTASSLATPCGGAAIRVPWAIVFGDAAQPARPRRALADVVQRRRTRRRRCSRFAPAACSRAAGGAEVGRVARLDVELWTRRRHAARRCSPGSATCCPGRYAFGLTGRGPTGSACRRGDYGCGSSPTRRTAARRRPDGDVPDHASERSASQPECRDLLDKEST